MRGQAALQGVYNPDRLKSPLLRDGNSWLTLSFSQAEGLLKDKLEKAAKKGPGRVHMVTEVVGEGLLNLFTESLNQWNSRRLIIFEPYAYECLKSANQAIFGVEGLPSYRMEEADLLLSFGADFLETWLSPVAYARKFKAMHSLHDGKKGLFLHISSYQSLTGANADLWLSCNPGSEAVIALGLIREAMQDGKGMGLPETRRESLRGMTSSYTKERVIQLSGMAPNLYEKLLRHVAQSHRPLILGPGLAASGAGALQAHMAVNLLNLVLDPELTLFDFQHAHRVEIAAKRSEVLQFFRDLKDDPTDLLLLNNVNPVFTFPPASGVKEAIKRESVFVVSFSNFMDETAQLADLVFPVQLPLETWDTYEGIKGTVSTIQPAMASLSGAPGLGDLFVRSTSDEQGAATDFKSYLYAHLVSEGRIEDERDWIDALKAGGILEPPSKPSTSSAMPQLPDGLEKAFQGVSEPPGSGLGFIASPSVRFFDGRGANRPWLCELPDPVTRVAWQAPVLIHPDTLADKGLKQGDVVHVKSKWGALEAPVYETKCVRPGVLVMVMGQGHEAFGRYAKDVGTNPVEVLPPSHESGSGAPLFYVDSVTIEKTGRTLQLAHTDGSRTQYGRKIALSVQLAELGKETRPRKGGLSMSDFPLTLPLAEGYSRDRDAYPAHAHDQYRWAMAVDLDRCIGCGACVVACYAENNIGIVGAERIVEGREMAWLSIERYHEARGPERLMFLPMLCQHCDNAPCESVCPVYAPHHSKEGLNNQIYNRCIGTRFCSQNCPYKVRRFNWFAWKWPDPLQLQLNPDVTVRSKGVMEKCSFCIQRIKEAHGIAKDKERKILDGEIQPACLQTCPTGAFIFGNLMDSNSQVRRMVADKRAYQVMGYLNTKPAVIYLKKVLQEI
jgi:molybdopterin-containing oxidoreductase family iron-sulfur binding subunit